MKVKSLIQRLFDGIKGKRKASPAVQKAEQGLKECIDRHPEISKALKKFVNALPSVESKSYDPIGVDDIKLDAAAIIVVLMSAGYDPIAVLALLSRVYGSIMASAPPVIGMKDGKPLTVDKMQEHFFKACVNEREIFQSLNNSGTLSTNLEGKTLH